MKYLLSLYTAGVLALAMALAPASRAADVYSTKDAPTTTTTISAGPASWNGLWAAALAGYGMANTDLSLDVLSQGEDGPEKANLGKLNGWGGEGWNATLQLGGDVQLGGGRVVVGGWGEYTLGGAESSALINGLARLDTEFNDSYGAFARIGLTRGDTLFYVAGGYVWTTLEASVHGGGQPVRLSDEIDMSGPAAELGIEHRFGPNVRGRLSARYTWLEEETIKKFGGVNLEPFSIGLESGLWDVKAGIVLTTDFTNPLAR